MPWFTESAPSISRPQVEALVSRALDEAKSRICQKPRRVLLLPPDITRMHSGAGWITEAFYKLLADTADRIANIRASEEGREGVASFLEKRKPSWLN